MSNIEYRTRNVEGKSNNTNVEYRILNTECRREEGNADVEYN